jgi:hypothetical protein
MVKSVFFFCSPVGPADNTGYEHQIVCLAEGLKEIGVSIYSNIDYWRENDDFLLKYDENVNYKDCDVVVYSSKFTGQEVQFGLPVTLYDSQRSYKLVYVDDEDGLITPGFEVHQKVDYVLKSHYNRKYTYPFNFRPWQFGLTNRIINAVSSAHNTVRDNEILVNFRVHHPTREFASTSILPIAYKYLSQNTETDLMAENESEEDKLFWHQTGRRHYSNYYKRLSIATACACFGGYLQKSIPFQKYKLGYYLRHLDYKFKVFKNDKVYQYDSWRFWESLVAGCCTIHIDLAKYGAVMPVMPVNGVHYLGVDFDDPAHFEKQLAKGTDFLQQVGEQGRMWVLENYSPKATAHRFLNLLY